MDPKAYYDEFSASYDKERHRGYHALIDELEVRIASDHVSGKRVLEAGCGTGMILKELALHARSATGVDLSGGMLRRAHDRGLGVAQADVTAIPFPDGSFDVVCSFKVLAHVPAIDRALAELVRVTRPGGTLLLEFYNSRSLRAVAKKLGRPRMISAGVDESQVFTRFDTPASIERALPAGVEVLGYRGVRVVSPGAFVYRIPVVGSAFATAERLASRSALSRFGGFLVAILRKG